MKNNLITILEKILTVYNVQIQILKKPYKIEGLNLLNNLTSYNKIDLNKEFVRFIKSISNHTIHIIKSYLGIQYMLFIIPESNECVIIGPYKTGDFKLFDLDLIDEFKNGDINNFKNYFYEIPLMDENVILTNIYAILTTVYPKMSFEVKHIIENSPLHIIPSNYISKEESIHQIKMIENRYKIENELMDAVSKGDSTKSTILLKKMMTSGVSARFSQSLRILKNSLYIFNTLLRKAIEKGNVHPYYIDQISSYFSIKIESVIDEKEIYDFMNQMVNDYCEYVHKYSHMNYSPIIQKVIQYININLSKEITLNELSELVSVNPSYLSSTFRNETGVNLIYYINSQKIEHASYMLRNSKYSISYIAHSVGFYDLNYFSRVFKKHMGCTPTNYRKSSF